MIVAVVDDDVVVDRNDIHTSYPALLGSTQSFRPDLQMADDDVLSYTSTEFEGNDPIPTSSMPFSRDVLLNMNLSGGLLASFLNIPATWRRVV